MRTRFANRPVRDRTPALGFSNTAPPSCSFPRGVFHRRCRRLRPGAATHRACSALVVSHHLDGLLSRGDRRLVASCSRPWGSPGFGPRRGVCIRLPVCTRSVSCVLADAGPPARFPHVQPRWRHRHLPAPSPLSDMPAAPDLEALLHTRVRCTHDALPRRSARCAPALPCLWSPPTADPRGSSWPGALSSRTRATRAFSACFSRQTAFDRLFAPSRVCSALTSTAWRCVVLQGRRRRPCLRGLRSGCPDRPDRAIGVSMPPPRLRGGIRTTDVTFEPKPVRAVLYPSDRWSVGGFRGAPRHPSRAR